MRRAVIVSMPLCIASAVVVALVAGASPALAAGDEIPRPSGANPGNRGYELVSPPDKNGADIEIDGKVAAAESGDAVTYNSFVNFAGGLSALYRNQSLSARGEGGWSTSSITPPQDPINAPSSAIAQEYKAFSSDLTRGVARTWAFEGLPAVEENANLFHADLGAYAFEVMSRPLIPLGPSTSAYQMNFQGASDDFTRVVFTSGRPLTPDAPSENGDNNASGAFLYEWFGGQLRLVSVLPPEEGGGPVLTSVHGFSRVGGFPNPTSYQGLYPVSADGSRIFFTTINNFDSSLDEDRLYVRSDPDLSGPGQPITTRVDASERTVPASGIAARPEFQAANASGSRVFFTDPRQLTDDSTAGSGGSRSLYLWDADAPVGQRLTDLTAADPGGGRVIGGDAASGGVVGVDETGTTAYVVARGTLAAGAVAGEPNLYVWREGIGLRLVATLDPGDEGVWQRGLNGEEDGYHYPEVRVTPDGERLLFRSRARLTSYDNAGRYQIYLYDAGDDALTCVSCNPRTASSTGDTTLRQKHEGGADLLPTLVRNLSADGSRAFFDAEEALVPEDTNGRVDVYVWDRGQVALISSGRSDSDAAFVDASADGDDVFFVARARLVAADSDNYADMYDARVGGGFPEPLVSEGCNGDSCQGALASPRAPVLPGSTTLPGVVDEPAPASRGFRLRRPLRVDRRRAARTGRLVVWVIVPARGRLVVDSNRGPARVVRAARAGSRKVLLRLARRHRRQLRRSGHLAVRITARFDGVTRRTSVTLRRPK